MLFDNFSFTPHPFGIYSAATYQLLDSNSFRIRLDTSDATVNACPSSDWKKCRSCDRFVIEILKNQKTKRSREWGSLEGFGMFNWVLTVDMIDDFIMGNQWYQMITFYATKRVVDHGLTLIHCNVLFEVPAFRRLQQTIWYEWTSLLESWTLLT